MDLYARIWRDDLWFPENSTGKPYAWKDLENLPGSSTYYPQVNHLHWSIVLAVALIGVRLVLEK